MRPVDADALKVHVCDMCDDGQRECKGDESCAILCWVNDMPTIESEVRHGRWIDIEDTLFYECSVCGNKHMYMTPYCAFCGSEMEATDTSVNGKGE